MEKTSLKLIAQIFILLSIISFSGCVDKIDYDSIEIKSTWAEQCETANEWQLGTMEKALDEIENIAVDELVAVGGYFSVMNCLETYPIMPETGKPAINDLFGLNEVFPVEYIERFDDDKVAVVYKVIYKDSEHCFKIVLKKLVENKESKKIEKWVTTGDYYLDDKEYSKGR